MGSSSSKDGASGPARSMVGSRVFNSSCLGGSSSPNNAHLLDHRNKEIDHHFPQTITVEEVEEEEDDNEHDNEEEEAPHPILLKQQQQRHFCDQCDSTSSSQQTQHLSTPTTRLRSRFSFIPPNFSLTRLTRAASFGSSSTSYSLFSAPNTQHQPLPSFITTQARHLLPPLSLHNSSTPNCVPISSPDTSSALSPCLRNHNSNQDNNANTHVLPDEHHHFSSSENTQSRRPTRQLGAREPVERSVRFSRTLSVGRLRDRVLRRSAFTDGLFGRLQQGREPGSSQENRRRGWPEMTTTLNPDGNAHVSPSTSTHQLPPMYNSIYNSQHDELETSRPREARYHDIMEHRTDFLERRRRIRSQVRALQRLGSRFENLSGHERSCILAGQHRSGHCTCRMSRRTRNPDDDTSARASISRIVMLAEALFEVLDEIHQQSVVLSSRASVSSLGSIPAPKEVVESIPVKIYTKLQKHQLEEVAQCYICLVEYEEGDCVRILPCQHEFHKTCIDKWLKEIHRVCPLCRGDVCKSESLSSEN